MDPSVLETIQSIIVLCTLITGISAAINVFATTRQKIQSPEKQQNDRILKLEEYVKRDNLRIKTLEENHLRFNATLRNLEETTGKLRAEMDSQRERMESVERGERVTQRALLALMNHMVNMDDGQDKSRLIEARDKLNEYLLEK